MSELRPRRTVSAVTDDALEDHDAVGLVEALHAGKVSVTEVVEAAIARAVATRWELHHLERRQPTLENVFLHYIGASPPEEKAA